MDDESPPRTLVRNLAVAYLAFVVYGSLVPLQYEARSFDSAVRAFRDLPFLRLGIESRADWVANLLLFIPLAMLFAEWLSLDRLKRLTRIGAYATLAALLALLAGAIEFTQLYFPARTVSQNDIAAESLGGLIGLGIHWTWGARLRALSGRLWNRVSTRDSLVVTLQIYLVLLVAYNLLPLDLTISPVEIYHKLGEGKIGWVPFARLPGAWTAAAYEIATDVAIWLPAGLLWGVRGEASIARIALKGTAFAAAVEFAQLFVYSRVTDVTDVVLAAAGTALGALGGTAMRPLLRGSGAAGPIGRPALWRAALAAWLGLALVIFWYPFDFAFRLPDLSGPWRVPFEAYYRGSEFRAATEVLHKIGLLVPAGVLFALGAHAAQRRLALGGSAVLGAISAFVIETGQLFLPGKSADLTDAVLEAFGVVAGAWLTRAVLSTPAPRPSTRSSPRPVHRTQAVPGPASRRYGWVEILILGGLALAIAIAPRLPFLPYNLRELVHPAAGSIVSGIGLAMALHWLAAGHLIFLDWTRPAPARILALPLWLVLHGAIEWGLVRVATPLESMHDIVGSPQLGWPWEWEMLLRFIGLDAVLGLAATGAALVVASIADPRTTTPKLLSWAIIASLVAPILYWGVVLRTETDNLVELMRDNASPSAAAWIATGFIALFVAASALSAAVARTRKRSAYALVAIAAIASSYFLFGLGAEPVIVKYDRVFSAFQFLLSSDREHYVVGSGLALRYYVAATAFALCIGALQWRHWRSQGPIESTRNLAAGTLSGGRYSA